MNSKTQKQKAELLRALHHSEKMLVLPNIWDPLGARLLEDLNYPAVATASASVAYTNGYQDGENIPFHELLHLLKKIAGSVSVPVTADIESGYAENDKQLADNIRALIGAGIAGINIEDTDRRTGMLYPTESQCARIRMIRAVCKELDADLFINARTDVYIQSQDTGHRLNEAVKRGLAYKDAGADCLFPIAIRKPQDIRELISNVQLPLNILTLPGIPDLPTLQELGVSRISLGPAFLKIAVRAMHSLALSLQSYEGLPSITENEITSDYLKHLSSKER